MLLLLLGYLLGSRLGAGGLFSLSRRRGRRRRRRLKRPVLLRVGRRVWPTLILVENVAACAGAERVAPLNEMGASQAGGNRGRLVALLLLLLENSIAVVVDAFERLENVLGRGEDAIGEQECVQEVD